MKISLILAWMHEACLAVGVLFGIEGQDPEDLKQDVGNRSCVFQLPLRQVLIRHYRFHLDNTDPVAAVSFGLAPVMVRFEKA
jgi:hypothetical protein